MLNTIAKRIQSRLSRQGLKVSLGEIKEQCISLITDINNPTEQELTAVQDYFINNATKLVVLTNDRQLVEQDLEAIKNEPDTMQETEEVKAGTLAPVPHSTKSELITSTAANLGISLSVEDVEAIAANINTSSDDLTDSLEEIKTAIIAFIEYKAGVNSQKINEALTEISNIAHEKFNQNSEQLTEGLKAINQNLETQSRDFKSKVSVALNVFKIPAIKAG